MELAQLRSHWSEVLNELEKSDRVAWLVYFDARLASWDGTRLTLDFSDSEKFANGIGFAESRDRHRAELQSAIKKVCGLNAEVLER